MTVTTIFLVAAAVIVLLWLVTSLRPYLIYSGSVGLLYRNGVFERRLEPGSHRIFSPSERTRVFVVPTREVVLPPMPLSLMSRDQFAFRITLVATVQVQDARAYRESIGFEVSGGTQVQMFARLNAATALHTEALNAAIAAEALAAAAHTSLDEFIAQPSVAVEGVQSRVADAAPGLALTRLLVTEVTVPPEVRKMFTEVERARREGLAQLERARGEQASLRALANAARSLSDNPQLAELRMLQLMESAKGNKTFVLGQARIDPASGSTAA